MTTSKINVETGKKRCLFGGRFWPNADTAAALGRMFEMNLRNIEKAL
jgi:hypothetical protein